MMLPLLFPATFAVSHLLSFLQQKLVRVTAPMVSSRFPKYCQRPAVPSRFAKLRYNLVQYLLVPQPMDFNRTVNSLVLIMDILYIFTCQTTFAIFSCYPNTGRCPIICSSPSSLPVAHTCFLQTRHILLYQTLLYDAINMTGGVATFLLLCSRCLLTYLPFLPSMPTWCLW